MNLALPKKMQDPQQTKRYKGLNIFHLLCSERSSKSLLGKVQPRWNVVVRVSEDTASERMLVAFGKLEDTTHHLVRILIPRFTEEPQTLPAAYH